MKESLKDAVEIDFRASRKDCGGLVIGGSCFISPFVIPENVKLDYKVYGYDGGPNIDPTA